MAFKRVQIRCECKQCEEWGLVELQACSTSHPCFPPTSRLNGNGELEHEADTLAGAHIGNLCERSNSRAELVVQNHRIEGRRVTLSKPLAVLERTGEAYSVVGVIRSKLLFDARPRAIVKKQDTGGASKRVKVSQSQAAAALFEPKRKRDNAHEREGTDLPESSAR